MAEIVAGNQAAIRRVQSGMSPVEELLLAELHADGNPALAWLRLDAECARILDALDLVVWDLHQLGTK